ncbi:UNVERIFIED_CONTAM: hypothetical protein FKN15_076704 [Acipenser sinensis]
MLHPITLPSKQREDSLKEVTESLQKTITALEEIHKECVFLHSDPQSSGSSSTHLSPPALRLAIVDLSQLMTAFSQLYDSDFKEYCNSCSSTEGECRGLQYCTQPARSLHQGAPGPESALSHLPGTDEHSRRTAAAQTVPEQRTHAVSA